MAGASMNGIKSRIKSVSGTMQITKAMELVATSKLRRAKERAEATRPFCEALKEAILGIMPLAESGMPAAKEKTDKVLFVVLAGDRGLAGGYNSNVFRLASTESKDNAAVYLPIGKKALEYYKHRGAEIFSADYEYISDLDVGDAFDISERIYSAFKAGEISKVVLIYTKFMSMISQVPKAQTLFPIECNGKCNDADPIFEGDAEEMLDKIIPHYIGGMIHSAAAEALASESGARRTAMNSANKNAEEMIGNLRLRFNRARQAVITQEITEIVSGADAMK